MLQVTILLTVLQLHGSLGAVTIPPPSGNLEVYALPVGQGDCTIIQCPMGELVINDCGSSGGNRWRVEEVQAFLGNRVNNIAAVFISHGQRDHYSYLPSITSSNNVNIQSVIIGGVVDDYPSTIHDWLTDFGLRLKLINNGSRCIGTPNCAVPGGTNFCNNLNIHFDILAANHGNNNNKNEKSIVLKVVSGAFSVLLPGDMEGPASIEIANALGTQLRSSVHKMAHHGASTDANKPEWLNPMNITRAFASSAYNFRNYGHPRCETIGRIQSSSTLAPATAHPFYCGNSGAPPTNYFTSEDMYETSPTVSTICLLKYSSTGAFNQDCMAAPLSPRVRARGRVRTGTRTYSTRGRTYWTRSRTYSTRGRTYWTRSRTRALLWRILAGRRFG